MAPFQSDSCDPTSQPLAAARAELANLVLDGPGVTDLLHQLAVLAASIVPGTHCGVTLRRAGQVATVAHSDEVATRMDEAQYVRGNGPCLEAIDRGVRIEVPDMSVEGRWDDYPAHALANGIHSICSLPLTVDGQTLAAVNLYAPSTHAFSSQDVARAEVFAGQAAITLALVLRRASQAVLDEELRDALATRSVVDQALGILMVTSTVGAQEAFESLRQTSQATHRKVSAIAAELIETMTGHRTQLATGAGPREQRSST